jgi:hypothetical protein
VRGAAVVVALALLSPTVGAAPDPAERPLRELRGAIDALGRPEAGEVESERAELDRMHRTFSGRAARLRDERDAVTEEFRKLDRRSREREYAQKTIDLDQTLVDQDLGALMPRMTALLAEKREFEVAKSGTDTESESQVEQINAWAARGNAKAAILQRENAAIVERLRDIERRRADLLVGVMQDATASNWAGKRRARVDHETVALVREIHVARRRTLAVSQIRELNSGPIDVVDPDEAVEKAVTDLFKDFAKEAGLQGLEGKAMGKLLAKVGLRAQPVGAAFTVADSLLDVGLAGADHRRNQVCRDLLLVGDYGEAMKEMVKAKGRGATQDPAYLAMREELDRLTKEMPSNEAEALWQALNSGAALVEALASLAGSYVGGKVGQRAAPLVSRLNNADRAVLGKGGVVLARRTILTIAKPPAGETTKSAVRRAAEQVEALRSQRAKAGPSRASEPR